MRAVLQVTFLLTLILSVGFADSFREKKLISLKKDEQKKILVEYGAQKKLFKFRWTLYKNEGLVIFRSYDRIVAQNILFLNHNNQSFRLELKGKGADYNVPYILVQFQKFDYEKKSAIFELFLADKSGQVQLKYLDEKAKKN